MQENMPKDTDENFNDLCGKWVGKANMAVTMRPRLLGQVTDQHIREKFKKEIWEMNDTALEDLDKLPCIPGAPEVCLHAKTTQTHRRGWRDSSWTIIGCQVLCMQKVEYGAEL